MQLIKACIGANGLIYANLKIKGGLGFCDLCRFNIALLAKQGWRLLVRPDSLVARIFKARYFPHTDFWNAQLGNYASYVWKSIYAVKKLLEEGVRWVQVLVYLYDKINDFLNG